MSQWWYAVNEQKRGPHSVEEIKTKMAAGVITGDTLVWSDGMESWTPLKKVSMGVPELGALPPEVPPQLLPSTPGPVRRFFARAIDLWLFCLPGTAVLFALGNEVVKRVPFEQIVSAFSMLGLLILASAFFVESVICSVVGNTPGKAVLGIRLTRANDGRKLSAGDFFSRNFQVWLKGLAIGFPLISLFTAHREFRRLLSTGTTTYDKDQFWVRGSKAGVGRYFMFVLLAVAVGAANYGVQVWGEAKLTEAIRLDNEQAAANTQQVPPPSQVGKTTAPKKDDGWEEVVPATSQARPKQRWEDAPLAPTQPSWQDAPIPKIPESEIPPVTQQLNEEYETFFREFNRGNGKSVFQRGVILYAQFDRALDRATEASDGGAMTQIRVERDKIGNALRKIQAQQ